jgi:hypothetical protein
MSSFEAPYVLSPALGCPRILGLNEQERSFPVILCATEEPSCLFSLTPSASNEDKNLHELKLTIVSTEEVVYDLARLPSTLDETWESISHELFTAVLGGELKIFKIVLSLPALSAPGLLRGEQRATLYDLLMEGPVSRKKPHAVCLTKSKDSGVRFIHLTDLHLAKRNEIIEYEVASAIGPASVEKYNNFNQRMRSFIMQANKSADDGDLDLILIGGDLVDFVNHGISDDVDEDDNNWHVFTEILTGSGNEKKRGNPGIKVPVFTTTGNHDWRLHPYDVSLASGTFGLSASSAENFDFEYYNTVDELNAKKKKVCENITKEGSPIQKENLSHTVLKWLLNKSETWQAKVAVPPFMTALANWILGAYLPEYELDFKAQVLIAVGWFVLHAGVNLILRNILFDVVSKGVIPIEASVKALHPYFLHINPYFNYAFSYGNNYFILMDTGPDCLVGQYFWDRGNKKMRRLSVKDNILGGSPDSMAFYPANEYYTYGQIPWLERILRAVEKTACVIDGVKRIFICLHSPPVNVKTPPALKDSGEVLLKEGTVSTRYGTTNHHVSQFLHLCLSMREGDASYSGPLVDIVFSGHAHQKIEFRVDAGLKIYCGRYSDNIKQDPVDEVRPLIAQTGACGPLSKGYGEPPYYRTVHVDKEGVIHEF